MQFAYNKPLFNIKSCQHHIIMGVGGAKVLFGRGLLEYKQLCDWRVPNRIMGNVVSFHTIIKKYKLI